jgi:hypothetical protein
MEKNWERSAKVFGDRLVIGDGPVYPNWSWNWWYSLSLPAKVRSWPTLVQTHFWGVSRGWCTTYRPFCRVASGPALKVDPRVPLCHYCSMWLALTVLCQIINLIQNFWFGSYLFTWSLSRRYTSSKIVGTLVLAAKTGDNVKRECFPLCSWHYNAIDSVHN